MVRTQIQLTREQVEALKRLAAEEDVSVAEVIRRSIDAAMGAPSRLSSQERWRRALAAVGRYRSADSDVSVNHDRYLAEAYES